MEAEIVTLAAQWMADATSGVGAQLATLARVGTDPLPSTPVILTERALGAVARWRTPDEGTVPKGTTALLLAIAGGDQLEQAITEQAIEAEQYRLVVTYLHRDPTSIAAVKAASYVQRAVRRCWLAFNAQQSTTTLSLNNVTVIGCAGFQPQRRFAENDDTQLLFDQVVLLHVLDDPR